MFIIRKKDSVNLIINSIIYKVDKHKFKEQILSDVIDKNWRISC